MLGRGGSPGDLLRAYRQWSNEQVRQLSFRLTAPSLDALITTPRHWTLQALDPGSYGDGLWELVQLEIDSVKRGLESARRDVATRQNLWGTEAGSSAGSVVMLDTNVILRHFSDLLEIDWSSAMFASSHHPIILGVPLVVVEELDGLKSASNSQKMTVAGDEQPTRSLARQALKALDSWFSEDPIRVTLRPQNYGNRGLNAEVKMVLVIDDLDHQRLPSNDAEIIDLTMQAKAYTTNVALASYDTAMLFRARALGVAASRPVDEELGR